MNFVAFFYYVIFTAFTPGPNNIMSMTNAGKYGFKRSLPFNLGIFAGFLIVMGACAAFSSILYSLMPSVKPVMLCIGALYMLWLAWTVWQDKAGGETAARTNTVLSGMLLQFVNIKVILYGLTTMSSYILPYYRGLPVAGFVVFLSLVGFVATCCWSLFGVSFERLFKKHGSVLKTVMALSLIYCAVMMVLDI